MGKKKLENMTEDELAEERQSADEQIVDARARKAEVQAELNRRATQKKLEAFTEEERKQLGLPEPQVVSPNGIESEEKVGS